MHEVGGLGSRAVEDVALGQHGTGVRHLDEYALKASLELVRLGVAQGTGHRGLPLKITLGDGVGGAGKGRGLRAVILGGEGT